MTTATPRPSFEPSFEPSASPNRSLGSGERLDFRMGTSESAAGRPVPPVRDDLAGLRAYGAPQLDVPVRLNTNETPYAVPEEVLDDLARRIRGELELNRYPDRDAAALRAALARRAGHHPEGTWAANGSNEILQQLLQAYGGPGRRALVIEPTYAMYPLIARATATEVVSEIVPRTRPVTAERAAELVGRAGAEITFWCSPNNPTGEAYDADVLAAVAAAAPGLVVLDEAYGEFGSADGVPLLPDHPNLVVTRTFSKALRLAGLRLGYLLADPRIVDSLQLVRLPYHLSALTQTAALCALDHADVLGSHVAATATERERVAAALAELPGVDVLPSQTNFLCFGVPPAAGGAQAVWQALLDRGVLVRDISRAKTLDRYLRVTIGTPAENDAFLAALQDTLEEATG